MATRRVVLFAAMAGLGLGACSHRPPPQAATSYCYRTLADVTCYTKPVPQDRAQLQGYAGPAPDAWADVWVSHTKAPIGQAGR